MKNISIVDLYQYLKNEWENESIDFIPSSPCNKNDMTGLFFSIGDSNAPIIKQYIPFWQKILYRLTFGNFNVTIKEKILK